MAEKDASWFFYHCAHGASNSPCPYHFPEDSPVMPDNWAETYVSPGPPGITDTVAVAIQS
jgi:hypothetical protein